MKRVLFVTVLVALLFSLMAGCASKPKAKPAVKAAPAELAQPIVRRPDMLDHKNYKWGTQAPEWVTMDVNDLEAMDKYKSDYVFKFESPRAQNLQGAELWTRNFTAAAEIAQQVRNRVQVKFAGAAAGDMNQLGSYMEQVVKSFSDATFAGFRQRDSYWVQMRYYKPDNTPEQDAFTYLALYTIPKTTLDELVRKALDEAGNVVKPKTQEEQTARQRVQEAFGKEGI